MGEKQKGLSIGRNFKIGLFHLGSGMADVLSTGVWNRIMISDLGYSAGPVGLLLSLRYFLTPLGIWAGRVSDRRTILGFRRLFWIWLGRLLMALSTAILGISTAQLVVNRDAPVETWLLIGGSLIAFSLGNAISGSTFLALIYDRSTEAQRGRAIGIVWTMLLVGLTIGGIVFSLSLPHTEGADGLSFTADDLFMLFLMAAVIFAVLWFVSLWGEERRGEAINLAEIGTDAEHQRSFRDDVQLVWSNRSMRFFLIYLVASMFFAFSQDVILEPFAGDVFEMPAHVTNRFSTYWGTTAILGSLFSIWLSRRVKWFDNTRMSVIGTAILFVTFIVLAVSGLAQIRQLVTPGLILLGLGLGLWNIGTLGLMMDFSPTGEAGTFLGFWSMCVTLARGAGVGSGGWARDAWLQVTQQPHIAYGLVFVLGAVGLAFSLWAVSQIDVSQFKRDVNVRSSEETAAILAGAME
ncbi:BCD family MFS transporter [Phototrophicus methaneseepsis]|uniref:BCD family MFS transporter n=1 Tax=Phototrophicus methaneseepsis TaxID=2710758 RepID=A0A7S8E8A5_9CHLR|nr:BCD family MFS transporter [Phototrophicus methaneseepsis]QPC82192.1 BCD family MFS transporter [Phototrophicus methaneseepsis]